MFGLFSKKPKQLTEMEIAQRELEEEYSKYKEPVVAIAKAMRSRPKTFKVYLKESYSENPRVKQIDYTIVDTVTNLSVTATVTLKGRTVHTENTKLSFLQWDEINYLAKVLREVRQVRLDQTQETKRLRVAKLYS